MGDERQARSEFLRKYLAIGGAIALGVGAAAALSGCTPKEPSSQDPAASNAANENKDRPSFVNDVVDVYGPAPRNS